MRFHIVAPPSVAPPVWDDATALHLLDQLVWRAEDAAHEMVLRDADLLANSQWFQTTVRSSTRDRLLALCEMARASAWSAPPAPNDCVITTADDAERALRIARTPLRILIENKLRDGALLQVAVCLLAGEPLRRLWLTPPVPGVVELVHAGGTGDMPGFLRQAAAEAARDGLSLRMLVVADSDRAGVDRPASPKAQEIAAVAAQVGAIAFILTKREAENYLPDFHWKAERQRDPRNPAWIGAIDALLAMSKDDRDYCDMEGFGLKGGKKLPAGYDTARPYHLAILCARVQNINDPAIRQERASALRDRDHTGDLDRIIQLIDHER
jgi:hypothetical protein